eukprot:TRINITY_DN6924_c0_g1_i1.p2 TRINITY_DN6924_c0_g1~~TRINITY_DN6924_c0_g1_i1.p2  ORF type:complete len:276 (+),score=100.51 TRINITY_DN6924_c0_g1_i1:63-830(+)
MPGHVRQCPKSGAPPASAAERPALVYWDIRGLAEPCRLCLEYVGADFDDVRIDAGSVEQGHTWTVDGKEMKGGYKEYWLQHIKPQVSESVPFVNLPYFIDGDLRLVQSGAILRHIARKYPQLIGPQPALTDVLLDAATDFDSAFTGLCYASWSEGGEATQAFLQKTLPAQLSQFDRYAGTTDGPFVDGGSGPTIADFKLFELLRKVLLMSPPALDGYPRLQLFVRTVSELPAVADYIKSGRAIDRPLNNPHAKFR